MDISLIACATRYELPELIDYLMSQQCDINRLNDDGQAAIHLAAIKPTSVMLQHLLTYPCNINLKNKTQFSPLELAVGFDRTENVKLLLKHNADINSRNESQQTPLHMAVQTMLPSLAKFLANEKGVIIDAVDKKNWAPMHYAVRENQWETVKMLQDAGSKIDPHQFELSRQVAIVFNNDVINTALEKEHDVSFDNGGRTVESVKVMLEMMPAFMHAHPEYVQIFGPLYDSLKDYNRHLFFNTEKVELPTKSLTSASISTMNHAVYLLIKEFNEDEYKITLCDRGLFAFTNTNNAKQVYPMIDFYVPKASYAAFIREIDQIMNNEDIEQFHEFVAAQRADYKKTGIRDVQQQPFKRGRCFF